MRIIFKFYCFFIVFLLFSTCAYAFEYDRHGVVAIDYMPDLNYPESFKIIDDYNNKKNSLNECVIKGIKLLEKLEVESPNKSLTANERKHPGKDFDNLYDFLALTYSNYDKLSPEALNVLNSSIWGMGKYINKQFTSEEIAILHSQGKTNAYENLKYYNVIDCFNELVKAQKLDYCDAAIFMLLIDEYSLLIPLKINLDNYSDYFSGSSRDLYGWITIHYKEIKKNKKSFRILQFIHDLHWNFKDRLMKNKNLLNFKVDQKNEFDSLIKISCEPEYADLIPITKTALKNVYTTYLKIKQAEKSIQEPLCWKKRENQPKLLKVTLKKLKPSINGETTPDGPIDSNKHIKPLTVHIDIDPQKITKEFEDDQSKFIAIFKFQ